MPTRKKTTVGVLQAVHVARMIAELDPKALQGDSGEGISPGHVGGYLTVVQGKSRIVGQVRRVERNHQGTLESELTPIGEIDPDGNFHRGVVHYPSPGASVEAAGIEVVRALFEKARTDGLELGTIPAMAGLPVSLDPVRLFGRHVAVLGQSGAGKSWAVANMVQRTVKQMPNAHIVILDLHGEYCWREPGGRPASAFDPGVVRSLDARDLEIPYWMLTFDELIDLLIDRQDEHAPTHIDFIRENIEDLKRRANAELNFPYMTVDAPVYFSLEQLYERIKAANTHMLDFGKTRGPLFGLFDQLLIRFESRLADTRYQFLFRPKKRITSDSLEHLLRDFVGLGEPRCQVTVIDMSAVPFDVRPTVSAQIGRLAFEFNYWNRQRYEFPLFLVCEEAHVYIPREQQTPFEGARRSMERIAKEGRKYGIGLCVVSQRPKELSETVLAQCGNFLCLRISNPDDQDYVRQLVPEGERNLIDTLSALGRGEVLVLGESIPVPTRFRFHRPDPTPHSDDVDFRAGWTEGPDDLDVEDIVERWRWQQR